MCRRQKCQESFFFFFDCFEVKFWMVSLSCGCLGFLYSLFISGLSCKVKRMFLQLRNFPVCFSSCHFVAVLICFIIRRD